MMSYFNNFNNLLLSTLMDRLQIGPPNTSPSDHSLSQQSLEELVFDVANLSGSEDESNKTQLVKEESKLKKEIVKIILYGKIDALKPNYRRTPHLYWISREAGSDYRVWEWHGLLMLFDEEEEEEEEEKGQEEEEIIHLQLYFFFS